MKCVWDYEWSHNVSHRDVIFTRWDSSYTRIFKIESDSRWDAFDLNLVTMWAYQVKLKWIRKSPVNLKISGCLHHVLLGSSPLICGCGLLTFFSNLQIRAAPAAGFLRRWILLSMFSWSVQYSDNSRYFQKRKIEMMTNMYKNLRGKVERNKSWWNS